MTRDQAIRKFMVAKGMPNHPDWSGDFKDVGRFIDGLAALGLINLEKIEKEPITLCGEDPDWNWWLAQPPAFKAAAVKRIRFPDNGDAAIQKLIDGCRGVPYLATTINETLERAGLKIVEK